jgi:pimeloyl-ACP methyl ester carboxylesterase
MAAERRVHSPRRGWPSPPLIAAIALIGLAAAPVGLTAMSLSPGSEAEAIAQVPGVDPVDCEGPVPDAEPGTAEYLARDANNTYCAVQRHLDQTLHPVSPLPASTESFGLAPMTFTDAYREPSRHAGQRFRFEEVAITNRAGEQLAAELYLPCAPGTCELPDPLRAFAPPYPAVVVLHGGGSRKELHWWSSQTLAEAGYMVVTFNGAAGNLENASDVLDWLLATPARPTAAGEHNPHWQQLDRDRVGLAGHSMGGQAASVLGQTDQRVSAIVSWDRGTGLPLPDDLQTPTLFFVADYACQANPICQPEPYPEPPQGEGPGERGREYEVVRAAGVDAMKISLRATTHLDWTLSEPAGNRYGEIVSVYYTLAWFDRYLKGADDPGAAREAFDRLVTARFDDYADRHNISQGLYDPALAAQSPTDPYAGNVPYRIAGMPVADRLSFYFRSKCSLAAPASAGGAFFFSADMRAEGCTPAQGQGASGPSPTRGARPGAGPAPGQPASKKRKAKRCKRAKRKGSRKGKASAPKRSKKRCKGKRRKR